MVEKIKSYAIVAMGTLLFVIGITACTGRIHADQPTGGDYALNNQNALFQNAARAVGWHQPHSSAELETLLIRNMRYNDPNHKSYVYVYANNGVIKSYFPVIGKCVSTDSSATSLWHAQDATGNNDTTGNHYMGVNSNSPAGVAVDSPQLDGSYGANEPGITCIVDEPGRPMVTFNGDYFMSDAYMPLKQAPELIINPNRNGVKGNK